MIDDLNNYEGLFADRINGIPRSFIREILKVTSSPNMISFAGGLPNPDLFPVEQINDAIKAVMSESAKVVMQYSNTEGYLPLRQWIAAKYLREEGVVVHPDTILITSGSQQGLDLIGKVLVNKNDNVVIEEPGYLGAIQALSMYQPNYISVPLLANGIDVEMLQKVCEQNKVKLMYSVPNFQNPSGLSYAEDVRNNVAHIFKTHGGIIVEDNPYGDLRFSGTKPPSFYALLPEQTLLLGSFSKTIVPGFRLGWIVAPVAIMDKLITAKQAADLHTSGFTQQVVYRYLTDNNSAEHISKIIEVYGRQRQAMVAAIDNYFPKEVSYTLPDGGMFLWITLPAGLSSLKLFEMAIKNNVAIVPGIPFYADKREDCNTARLNFSCANEDTIREGVKRLGAVICELMELKCSSGK